MTPQLSILQGGDESADTVLILLHGLGATGEVWNGLHAVLRERRWPGRWITPDLPGHGGSAPLSTYSFSALAAAIAAAIPPAKRIVVLGHSLGGVVALELASGRYGLKVDAVCGLGIKIAWTIDELARAQAISLKPSPIYATRIEAAERHLKLAGLARLIAPDAVADTALRGMGNGWTIAFDPLAFAVGAPDMPALLASAKSSVLLAAGERDPMCGAAGLQALWPETLILPGLGHNAQVENPEALWPLLKRLAAGSFS